MVNLTSVDLKEVSWVSVRLLPPFLPLSLIITPTCLRPEIQLRQALRRDALSRELQAPLKSRPTIRGMARLRVHSMEKLIVRTSLTAPGNFPGLGELSPMVRSEDLGVILWQSLLEVWLPLVVTLVIRALRFAILASGISLTCRLKALVRSVVPTRLGEKSAFREQLVGVKCLVEGLVRTARL